MLKSLSMHVLISDAMRHLARRRSRGKMEPELIHVAGEAANQGGCVLCNSPDFLRGGFGDRTMIICDQCEREFHIGCLAEHGRAKLTELPDGLHPSPAFGSQAVPVTAHHPHHLKH